MPKPRRRPPRLRHLPRLLVPLALGLVLALCAWGFVHFSLIALDQQAHFAADSVHPWDGYAVGFLFVGMVALAGILLSLREPVPGRWRRGRRRARFRMGRGRAKPRRHSGTIGLR